MPTRYVETQAKSILNAVRGMGFGWSVNPYRGCVHGCHYCFARRYHTYLELGAGEDFTGVILVKVNAVAVLRAELSRRSWQPATVAVGTATDPYQPIEGRYRLTRGILEALADARTPASVITKGPMVIRDRDVLAAVRDRAGVTVCVSLTTLDRDRWRRLEPGTAPPHQRLRAVGGARGGRHPRRSAARADRSRADDRPRESRGGRPRGGRSRRPFPGGGGASSRGRRPRALRRLSCRGGTNPASALPAPVPGEPGARRRRAKPPVDRGRSSPPLPSQRSPRAADGSERPTTRERRASGERLPAEPGPVSRSGPRGGRVRSDAGGRVAPMGGRSRSRTRG